MSGLSLAGSSRGYSLLWYISPYGGFSCLGAQALGTWASVVEVHGFSGSAAGKNLPGPVMEPLHWETDSYPVRHQGSHIRSTLTATLKNLLPPEVEIVESVSFIDQRNNFYQVGK